MTWGDHGNLICIAFPQYVPLANYVLSRLSLPATSAKDNLKWHLSVQEHSVSRTLQLCAPEPGATDEVKFRATNALAVVPILDFNCQNLKLRTDHDRRAYNHPEQLNLAAAHNVVLDELHNGPMALMGFRWAFLSLLFANVHYPALNALAAGFDISFAAIDLTLTITRYSKAWPRPFVTSTAGRMPANMIGVTV